MSISDVCITSPLADRAASSSDSSQTQIAAAQSSTAVAVGGLSGRLEMLSTARESVDVDRTSGRSMKSVHRDSSADGAEDSATTNLAEVPVQLSSGSIAASDKVPTDGPSHKSMTVSTLQSGIYIAKSVAQAGNNKDQPASGENISRQIVRQPFPLLQNLKDTGSHGTQRMK